MAKVLFVIRLPAHEKELINSHNAGCEKNENIKGEESTEVCIPTKEGDKTSNALDSDSTASIGRNVASSTETDGSLKRDPSRDDSSKVNEDPGWDFDGLEDSESSTAWSTAESSPCKEPEQEKSVQDKEQTSIIEKEKITKNDVPPENCPKLDMALPGDETSEKGNKIDDPDLTEKTISSPDQCSQDKKLEQNSVPEQEFKEEESAGVSETSANDKMETYDDQGKEEDVALYKPEFVRFVSEELTLLERVKSVLDRLNVTGVQWSLTADHIHVGMFIAGDGAECEEILNRLSVLRIGIVSNSSVSIFPANISVASVQEEQQAVQLQDKLDKEDKLVEKVEQFKKTIKSKLVIQQVIKSVEADAVFSFDYLMLIVLASLVALMGLLEASSVVLVASMLISPLMGPILAGVLGAVVRNLTLLSLGIKSELKGLAICIAVGFVLGLIPAGLEVAGLDWRSSDSWPTVEMSSRGTLRALPVGILIAIPSGAGVALSVLGGKVGSLVGVAISASLLPPAVNAGVLWAYAFLVAFAPPVTEEKISVSGIFMNETEDRYGYAFTTNCLSLVDNTYSQHYFCNMALESVVLGVVSLFLTLLNILCIIVMGVIVLKIKEVAPLPTAPDAEQEFYGKTLKIARESYQTTKGASSLILRDKFLQEYKSFKGELGMLNEEADDAEGELDQIMQDVETSPDVNGLLNGFPYRSHRWSSYWGLETHLANQDSDRAYKTVNLGRVRNEKEGCIASSNDMELHQLRRRKTSQLLTSSSSPKKDMGDRSEKDDESASTYFTIHRYIPPGQMRHSLVSPRHSSAGPLYPKIVIPKVSRFQIAKVPENATPKASMTPAVMPTISEQETLPLMGHHSDLDV
ncbi:hypothetical protein PoB_001367800 [Plakobranchus ocellatus]|uniref:Uncharacterized protein n=1 Tax=Plakobranchus ocellatus TaxID=259542 RepID=A0AAV3YY57_9GAST|nr:hypothetical protein PoB_001367800 [Plakobranchus ocellatus]